MFCLPIQLFTVIHLFFIYFIQTKNVLLLFSAICQREFSDH